MKLYIYLCGRGMSFNLLHRLLQKFLDLSPAMTLTIFLCTINIILLLMNYPEYCSIFHYRVKIGKMNLFESVNVADI
jgi:hypothetical protein